jgi:hypothetical protein
MDCKKEENIKKCPCTWESCTRKGICCECIHYHIAKDELPACFFPADVEKTYNRSKKKYIEIFKDK